MKFVLLIYNDETLLDALPPGTFDAEMRDCLNHADDMRKQGQLLDTQMLEGPATAKSVRMRNGRLTTTDGPFAEAKEVLGGFNLIEADSMEDAVRMASEFPWVKTGCVEIRPVIEVDTVRRRVFSNSRASGLIALLAASLAFSPLDAQQPTDWGNLQRYRQANSELPPVSTGVQRVVFMGNSITDSWARYFPDMFPGKAYIGRGISAQTTPQMLVRFRQDVVALKPAVVVILAGTNDIAGNTGPSTLEMIEDNLMSMTELAQANGIRVVLASVLPAFDYPWRKGLEPAPKIVALNKWIKDYAARVGATYLDFHSAMADDHQGLRSEFTRDGVHPNEAGYRVMAPLAQRAIDEALRRR
jgi:lysophospholipase L1-like esterase